MDELWNNMDRARFLRLVAAGIIAPGPLLAGAAGPAGTSAGLMQQRVIPSSGESLGVIGCGTWQSFDVGPGDSERTPLAEVLGILFEHGGSVIDSSPMYGRSEQVTGDLLARHGWHQRAFVATKVWTTGEAAGVQQMQASMRLLRDARIELMQIHNLVDWRTHLKTLRAWKEQGRIRYLGITHYTQGAYAELEDIMRAEPLDFVQLNYSIGEREADARLLPLAAEKGIAVLVNKPFGGGHLLRALSGRALPDWAAQLECRSWAQLLLKYVVSHPAVTCAIPGTSRPRHMLENCRAGMGVMPDQAMRLRIANLWGG